MISEVRPKEPTQREIILRHLQDKGMLDRITAFNYYGIFESPARVSELRKEGYDIETIHKTVKTRSGRKVTVAEWRLK
jgi:hypothetical protein